MRLAALRDLAHILGLRRPGRVRGGALRTRSNRPGWATASEARIAICRRMHPRVLWNRIRRGTWSRTSLAAARAVLRERALEE